MVVCLIFEKMLKLCFFVFVNLSFMCNLLFNIFIVGIYLVMNGIPMILCLISVM